MTIYFSSARKHRFLMALCVMLLFMLFNFSAAYAAAPLPPPGPAGLTLKECAKDGGYPETALVGPIVFCVKTTVKKSVSDALHTMSDYFKPVTAVIFILAVTMHGARMLSGERGVTAKSMALILKICFVSYFAYDMGGWADIAFGTMDEILRIVVGGFEPWNMIDDILGTIFGFAPGVLIFQGLMWLGAGMTSGWSSIPMSSGLIVMFIELVLFVIEICYTFLSSFVVIAFMIILSPAFIPLIIFQKSEIYFRKWLDTIVAAILIPVLLFAAMSFALGLFVPRVAAVFKTILPDYNFTLPLNPSNPPDFSHFWKINQQMMSYNYGVDTNIINLQQKALDKNPGSTELVPSAHTTVNPFNRGGFTINPGNPPQIDFGVLNVSKPQDLLLALITLWLYIALLKELVMKMPEVAQAIAGSTIGIVLRAPKLQEKVGEAKTGFTRGLGITAGGALGAQAGALSGSTRVTQAGAITGGVIGNVLARKFT